MHDVSLVRVVVGLVAALVLAASVVAVFAVAETRRRTERLEQERSLTPTRHGPIEHVEWGEGPPVLVIHGAGGGFDQGRLLARAVGPDTVRWIAVSRFGYLGSPLPETASTAAQAESFVDLLDALGVERASVLGMSGGVPPALMLARMFPERVDRMALLSSAPFTPFGPDVADRPVPTWLYSALLGNDVVYWTLTRLARPWLEAAFDARGELRQGLSEEEARFVEDLVDGFLPASRRVEGVGNEAAAVDPAADYALHRVRAGVLVVHARDDMLNPVAVGERIAAGIPGSRLVVFDRGGHLLLGHHAELRRETAAFLAP